MNADTFNSEVILLANQSIVNKIDKFNIFLVLKILNCCCFIYLLFLL